MKDPNNLFHAHRASFSNKFIDCLLLLLETILKHLYYKNLYLKTILNFK